MLSLVVSVTNVHAEIELVVSVTHRVPSCLLATTLGLHVCLRKIPRNGVGGNGHRPDVSDKILDIVGMFLEAIVSESFPFVILHTSL